MRPVECSLEPRGEADSRCLLLPRLCKPADSLLAGRLKSVTFCSQEAGSPGAERCFGEECWEGGLRLDCWRGSGSATSLGRVCEAVLRPADDSPPDKPDALRSVSDVALVASSSIRLFSSSGGFMPAQNDPS